MTAVLKREGQKIRKGLGDEKMEAEARVVCIQAKAPKDC